MKRNVRLSSWSRRVCSVLVVGIKWMVVSSAMGVIVADYEVAEAPPMSESSGGWDIDWDFVYRYKNSSAVAVAPHWILTAAHVADDSNPAEIVINGATYYQQEIVFHSPDVDPHHTDKADLALVRFAQEFPGHYPLYEGTFPSVPPQNRLAAIVIGYGRTGTVSSTHYNELPGGAGTRRWGTQRIEGPTQNSYDAGGLTGMTHNNGIQMTFELTDTPYEAGVGVYDSGGGTFVKVGDDWHVAGINTTRYGSGTNYTGIFAVSIPAYADWIHAVMDPLADLDGDGIPNYWEQRHSGSITGLVATADDDGDGMSNLEEYWADTDPNDAASFLRIDALGLLPEHEILFHGSTGRVYQVWERADLVDIHSVWQQAHTNWVWGSGGPTSIVVTNLAERVFYRLNVSLP